MNYFSVYTALINRAVIRNKEPGIYYESHHIFPKSLSNNNLSSNLVYLTGREHFIAHLLLVKMYDNHELKTALWGMCNTRESRPNSTLYELARRNHAEAHSKRWEDPVFRNKVISGVKAAFNKPGSMDKRKRSLRAAFNRPEVKLKMSTSQKEAQNRPDVKERAQQKRNEWLSKPENRLKLSTAAKNRRKPTSKIIRTEEYRKKNSESQKQLNLERGPGNHPMAKVVMIDGIKYDTQRLAAKALGVSPGLVQKRTASDKWPTWIKF